MQAKHRLIAVMVAVGLAIAALIIVALIYIAVPALAKKPKAHIAYTGHAGCALPSGGLKPGWTMYCAYHTHIRRIIVRANGSHWGAVQYQVGYCTGTCTSDSGYRSSEWNGRPTVHNNSGHTITSISAWDYF